MTHCKTEARLPTCFAWSQRGNVLIPALLLLLTVTAWAAAVWQWQRSQHHHQLAQVAAKQLGQPVLLNQLTSAQNDATYVKVQGHWLANSTVFVSPRMLDARMGAQIVTVFHYIDGAGQARYLVVNRGWAQQISANEPPTIKALTNINVTLEGTLVEALPRAFELKKTVPQSLGIWSNHDLTLHASLIGKPLDNRILQLSDTSPDGEAQQLRRASAKSQIAALEQKAASNQGYAFQWLGLALVGIVGLAWMWRSRTRQSNRS